MKYRLEFSEEQQNFHLAVHDDPGENTNGYYTILNNCSELQKDVFKAFLWRNEEEGVDGEKKRYSLEEVREAAKELLGFLKNLEYYNCTIKVQ